MPTEKLHIGIAVFSDIESGLDLAHAMSNGGHRVTLYLSHKVVDYTIGGAEPLEERFAELNLLPSNCSVRIFRFPRIRDLNSYRIVSKMMHAMRNDRIDLLHILAGAGDLWLAVLAYRTTEIPVVSTLVRPIPDQGEPRPKLMDLMINQLMAYGSDVLIVNGKNLLDAVKRKYHVPADRLTYIPLCPRFTVTRWPHQMRSEQPGMVLFFGKIYPYKGLEYLVMAQPLISREAPDVRIMIAGRGVDNFRCRQIIQEPSYFTFRNGFVPGPEMAELYCRASIVTLPYLSAATSGVLLDAYMFGKPVVVTRVGCLPEYVQDGITGILVPPRDPKSLAEAIIRLIKNEPLRRRMGENAREFVNEIGRTITAQNIEAYQTARAKH